MGGAAATGGCTIAADGAVIGGRGNASTGRCTATGATGNERIATGAGGVLTIGTSGGMSAADVGAVPGMRIGTRSPARAALITLSASATAINRQLAASRADALRGCSNAIAPSVPRGLIR
jgi:hypothetical protein